MSDPVETRVIAILDQLDAALGQLDRLISDASDSPMSEDRANRMMLEAVIDAMWNVE